MSTPTLPMLSPSAFEEAAVRVMERCDRVALCTEQPGQITRTFCSPAMREEHEVAGKWMRAIGVEPRIDDAGNLRGRMTGGGRSLPRILIGSHLDTVVNAGRYDGVLGVLMGLAVAELAAECGQPLPVEVIGFSEEEGVRYSSPYLGSRAIVGDFPFDLLDRTDEGGQTMRDALVEFGCQPDKIADGAIEKGEIAAYIEPHIEQGPVLENENASIATVTGIAGQTRAQMTITGRAAHAGAAPMEARRDALATAAEVVLAVESTAKENAGMVGTVGKLSVSPNVGNVIPGEVNLRLELRHLEDAVREQAFDEVKKHATDSAERRGIACHFDWIENQSAVACDGRLMTLMDQATTDAGLQPRRLASGAGHDAAIMAQRFPVGLLFIRCKGGISHHPDESVRAEDVARGIEVLWRTVWKVANDT